MPTYCIYAKRPLKFQKKAVTKGGRAPPPPIDAGSIALRGPSQPPWFWYIGEGPTKPIKRGGSHSIPAANYRGGVSLDPRDFAPEGEAFRGVFPLYFVSFHIGGTSPLQSRQVVFFAMF